MTTWTVPGLTALREAWDEPFLADPRDEAANAARGEQTRALAARLLSVPLGTRAGGMTLVSSGWSKERGAHARSVADPVTDPEAWVKALGHSDSAVLTSDGHSAVRTAWCADPPGAGSWVRYEHWSPRGCEAHGYVCPDCRKLTQTG